MGESARVLKYSFAIPVVLHGSVESYNDYKSYKRFYNKGHLNLAKEDLKGFSLGVFNRLCETHRKCYNNGNLESMSELIVFIKVAPKATVVN